MTTTGERAVTVHALTAEQLAEIIRQAEAGYPEEICGIVIGKPGSPETYRVHQVRNVANRERQQDTSGIERDARTAYRMDDREVLHVLREADEAGWDVVTFYHSHPGHDAYFSAMDRDRALRPDHEPLWPGASLPRRFSPGRSRPRGAIFRLGRCPKGLRGGGRKPSNT